MGDKDKGPLSVTYPDLLAVDVDAQYCLYVNMDRGTVECRPTMGPADVTVFDQQALRSTAFSVMDRCTPIWTDVAAYRTTANTVLFRCYPDVRVLGFTFPRTIKPALCQCECGWMDGLDDVTVMRFPVLVDKRTVWIPEPYSPKECVTDFYVDMYITWVPWDQHIKEQYG